MNDKIIQYALFKSIFDQKSDILECFYPFFIQSLDESQKYEAISCKKAIQNKFTIEIPIHVLQKLVRIAINKQHISIFSNQILWPIQITDEGLQNKAKNMDIRETERNINKLINGYIQYLELNGIKKDFEEAKTDIEAYVIKNTINLSGFFFEYSEIKKECFEDHERELTEYILEIEKNKPATYKILKELFYGSIIHSSLNLTQSEFNGVINSKFKNTHIYFDANYLFSLLGYHDEELAIPAIELYKLLLKFDFQLRVFDFTVSEMNYVLKNYIKNKHMYTSGLKIKSLYSVLKRKNFTDSDIINIISNLEEKLKLLKIYKKNTNLIIDNYLAKDPKISEELLKIKPNQGPYYHNHDICILEKIHSFRKRKFFNFEDPNCFVITSDFKLANICHDYFGHKSDSTISEVLLDRTMTNILFLKDPSIDLSLATIISGFSSELFIDPVIWEKFYTTLKNLKLNGVINDDKISNLFYHHYIEKELSECESSDVDIIDEKFVLEKIENAAKEKENETEQKIVKLEEEYEHFIESKDQENLESLKQKDFNFKLKIRKKAEKEAKIIHNWIRIGCSVILLIPLISALLDFIIIGSLNTSILSILRYSFFIIQSAFISIPKIWDNIYHKLLKWRDKKLTKELFIE